MVTVARSRGGKRTRKLRGSYTHKVGGGRGGQGKMSGVAGRLGKKELWEVSSVDRAKKTKSKIFGALEKVHRH